MGSKNATTDGFWMNANKSSCNEKQRGTSDHSKETCFTVNGKDFLKLLFTWHPLLARDCCFVRPSNSAYLDSLGFEDS